MTIAVDVLGSAHRKSKRRTFNLFTPLDQSEYSAAEKVRHFYSLDILRAVAAVVVLAWHYEHFFSASSTFKRVDLPLYWLLMPFYEYGYWAVGGFWVISGFVFAHVYSGKIVKASEFAAARFARLYPLHLITLVFIGIEQIVSFKTLGHYTLVAGNSKTDFVRHLFFVAGWGFTNAVNFNGPIWSVSVEIAIYIGFFLLARRLFAFGVTIPSVIVGSMALLLNEQSPINNFCLCAFFFFLGSILYYWLIRFWDRPLMLAMPAVLSLATFTYYVSNGFLPHMRFFDVQCFLFPPIVLFAGWFDFQPHLHRKIKPLKWFGDTTYSTYLWHFPIQVFVLTVFSNFGLGIKFFESPLVLILWIVGVVALAHFSFVYLEKPLQRWCNTLFRRAQAIEPRN